MDAAARIKRGIEVFGVGNGGIWHVASLVSAGASLPEPILVANDERSPLIVLEGHTRLTAYLLRPEYLPPELPVVVGYSPMMNK